ncbi:hypothetical protein FRC04_008271 [Tulasnella sp. 424]|nr:hypothetical protein FRC04_008271 [Tulasnella sp. 424]KAG8966912.1 hypothetical protein FRC05_002360 [Tulasnella sp. 425]
MKFSFGSSSSFKNDIKNLFSSSSSSRNPSSQPDADVAGRRGTLDDLKILAQYDTIFVIDDSGSMQGERWNSAKDALKELANLAKEWDSNGIDIYFLNSASTGIGIKTQEEVDELFTKVAPEGWTPTGATLNSLITPYVESLPLDPRAPGAVPVKPRNYIVITDGEATDEGDERLKPVILKLMKMLDGRKAPLNQLGIQFVQVGKDENAQAFLNKLDNQLSGSRTRDIVDTFPYDKLNGDIDAEHLVKMLLGSITKRIDNYNKL